MSERSARSALATSLRNWRRHVLAVAVAGVGFAVAAAVGTAGALYAAGLVAFAVWMLWFVLTAVDWIRRADF